VVLSGPGIAELTDSSFVGVISDRDGVGVGHGVRMRVGVVSKQAPLITVMLSAWDARAPVSATPRISRATAVMRLIPLLPQVRFVS
jgi:hypothetical protein